MRSPGRVGVWIGAMAALAVPGAGAAAPPDLVSFTQHAVAPGSTKDYDSFADPIDGGADHLVYVPQLPPVPQVLKLLVFFHGGGAAPGQYEEFMTFAARRGYYVIGLSYPTPGAPTPCKCHPDESHCFGAVRQEIAFGQPSAGLPTIDIASHPEESIGNRLKALLLYLRATYPSEGWSEFIGGTPLLPQPKWSSMVLAGHSAGSGFAAYLAEHFTVRRVIMFAGHADAPDSLPLEPAEWAKLPTTTPADRYYGLVHRDDLGPGSVHRVDKIKRNWTELGMVGDPKSVDGVAPPYGSRWLITSRCLDADPLDATPCPQQSLSDRAAAAHSAFIGDGPENDVYAPVWNHLLE